MWYYNPDHPLRRLFAGITEQTFMANLGVADPQLVDYLSILLSRFVHLDSTKSAASGKRRRRATGNCCIDEGPRSCATRMKHGFSRITQRELFSLCCLIRVYPCSDPCSAAPWPVYSVLGAVKSAMYS